MRNSCRGAQKKFGVTVCTIDISPSQSKPLWVEYLKSHAARASMPLSQLYALALGTPLPSHARAMLLDLGCEDKDGDAIVPLVRVFVR